MADIPVTGLSGAVSTTITTTSGSATITLPSTAIAGMTNGQVYSISGNPNFPAEAAFLYNSASTTQTLLYQTNYNAGGGTCLATASGTAVASTVTFINNSWMGSWFVDTDGTIGVMFRVSTTANNSYGTPGLGYMTCSNPGTFTSWSAWTPVTINLGTSGLSTATGLNMGSVTQWNGTYYLCCDKGVNGTATSARGPYTLNAAFTTSGSFTNSEGGDLIWLGGNNWREYLQDTTGGTGDKAAYIETTTGLTGTWTPVTQINYPAALTCAEIDPVFLSNTDDLANILPGATQGNSGYAIGYNSPGGTGYTYFLTPSSPDLQGWRSTYGVFRPASRQRNGCAGVEFGKRGRYRANHEPAHKSPVGQVCRHGRDEHRVAKYLDWRACLFDW